VREDLLGPEHADTLATRMTLANAFEAKGEHAQALARLERVAEVYARGGDDLPNAGIVWMNLGNLQRRTGALAAARDSLVRALDVLRDDYGPTHVTMGMALLNLAITERELGDLPAADEGLARAEAVMIASVGRRDPRLALVYYERGRLAVVRGDFVRAGEDYERAIAALEGTEHTEVEAAEIRAAVDELSRLRKAGRR
jgi:tetratricopeptide (TPR) repeat protein